MKHYKHILQVLALILFVYVYGIIHVDVENALLYMIPGAMKSIMSKLWTHLWNDRIISISLLGCAAIIIRKIHRLAYISLDMIILPFALFWVVCFSAPRWIQVNSGVFGIPFALILVLMLFICFLSCVAQCFHIVEQNSIEETSGISHCGFIPSNIAVRMVGVRKKFAYKIVDRLINTHNEKESFAIAIYGSWGSGKTVFLEEMRCFLQNNKHVVIEFNPWKCNSLNQIRKDFLEVVSLQLKQYDFSIARFFSRYSNLLSAFDTPNSFKEALSLIVPNKETISEVKEHIILSLQKIKKPLYVLIDDLDRLDADEILEVLKLIRNTANFPYLKFVVACDRKYVIEQLKSRAIDEKYLEKIFMVDFQLPQVYADFPCTTIWEKDVRLLTKNNRILNAIESLTFSQKELLNKCLGSFRQAKRFAGQIVVTMEFTEGYVGGKIINVLLPELLWVELLKLIDIDTYATLKDSPTSYLDVCKKGIERYGLLYYCLKKEESNTNLPKLDREILEQLFPVRNGAIRGRNAIAYLENFDKYFSYGMSARHISESEFLEVLYQDEDFNTIYNKYDYWKRNNLLQSMGNRILMTNTRGFELNEAVRFIYLTFLGIEKCKEDFYQQLILSKLMQSNYKISIRKELIEKILSILSSPVIVQLSHFQMATFLHEMYVLCLKKQKTLLSKLQIKEAIRNNLFNYLATSDVDASDVIDSESDLYEIVKQSSIATPIYDESDDIAYYDYESLVFDILLEFFSKHKSNNRQAVKKFEDLGIDCASEQFDEVEYAQKQKEDEIGRLFGTGQNYNLFKTECFL